MWFDSSSPYLAFQHGFPCREPFAISRRRKPRRSLDKLICSRVVGAVFVVYSLLLPLMLISDRNFRGRPRRRERDSIANRDAEREVLLPPCTVLEVVCKSRPGFLIQAD